MPELPEVEILTRRLGERLIGRTVERLELASISALKTFDPPLSSLEGSEIFSVGRRGKYVLFHIGDAFLAVHFSRSGWIHWREKLSDSRPRPGRGPLALRLRLEGGGGLDVTEMATEKRLALYVVRDPLQIEGISTLGPDPLSPDFSPALLAELLAGEKGDLKHALSRQSLIAGLGNAYSDEALHIARLSPFKPAGKLSPDEVTRLHVAITTALDEALKRSESLEIDELKDKKRTAMRVHGRTGLDCPVCGDTVREVSFSTRSLQYCPTCQTGGKTLADRRLSRLLK